MVKTSIQTQSRIVIGINAGARYVGVAILSGTELMDWYEKAFHGPWTEGKLTKILKTVERVIDQYGPMAIGLKRLHQARTTDAVQAVLNGVIDLAEKRNCTVYVYSAGELIKSILQREGTILQLTEVLVMRHPSIHLLAQREVQIKHSYHQRVIEAVACATCVLHESEMNDI